MENLNELKNMKPVRATGTYSQYDPTNRHKDTIYFAEDKNKIYYNGVDFTNVDLTNYYTKSEVDNLFDNIPSSQLVWKGTQEEYDAITTKDPNTIYYIV